MSVESPCQPWPIRWTCDIPCDQDEELVEMATSAAQDILWSLSGRRYGICEVTEAYRPPCKQCVPAYVNEFSPGVEYALGRERRDCCAIQLDKRPTRAIIQVVVEGVILDESEYTLERSVLKRLGECWPCGDGCEEAPVVVTYEWGLDVPPLGELAMGEVACEVLHAIKQRDCQLPSNAVRIDRQGVSIDLESVQTLYAMGRMGLPITDQFLRAVNPSNLKQRSGVYTPDFARRAR